MRRLSLTLLLLLATIAYAFPNGTVPPFFEYQFKIGDQWEFRQITESSITQKVMNKDQKIQHHLEGEYLLEVLDYDHKRAKIAVTFQFISMNITTPMGRMQMSSKSDQSSRPSDMDKTLNALIGKTFYLYLSRRGYCSEINGLSTLIDHAITKATGNDFLSQHEVRQLMEEAFSTNSITDSFQKGLLIYPLHAVAQGEQWQEFNQRFGQFTLDNETVWTLTNTNYDHLVYEGKTTFNDTPESRQKGIHYQSPKGNAFTRIITDRTSGWPKQVTQQQNFSMVMHSASHTDEIPMEVKATTSFTIKKIKREQ
ncbi:DUF6263 family protein [Algivirga pacifica]|uniref:Lipocalin-like domain-containing protein n=1 Tax=Algivirga pacifica TaxID=1162670 RepID=A0ABP9D4C9_9BACT